MSHNSARKSFILALISFLGILFFLTKVHTVEAATIFSDSFSGGYNPTLWSTRSSYLSPIGSVSGLVDNYFTNWAILDSINATILPSNSIVMFDVKINTVASDVLFSCKTNYMGDLNFFNDNDLRVFIHSNGTASFDSFISGGGWGGIPFNWHNTPGPHSFELNCTNGTMVLKEDGSVLSMINASGRDFNPSEHVYFGYKSGDSEFTNYKLCDSAGCDPTPPPSASPSPPPTPCQWNPDILPTDPKCTPPPCQWDGNISSTDPLCKQCQYNPNIIESNPNCVPPCQWDNNILSTDPLCKQCPYNSNIIESDPKCAPPITKVVLIPGFGGSWNADAILNCKADNYQGEWSSWNLGDQVYNPIITSINTSNYVAKPFYYDWRKQIPDTVPLLSHFISQNVIPREQIYMVGHSMGGLLGLEYIRGLTINNVVNKFLMAGSPHEGVLDAYPAWVGGDVGGDLFRKMSSYIALKNCHGNGLTDKEAIQKYIPSVQNILPIFDYIKDKKTGEIKPVASMHVTNNFLKEPLFTNTTLKTLSGIRETTLRYFDVNKPNNSWPDGKPEKKEYDIGDGTVLADSSVLTKYNVPNTYIQQDHLGLMSAQESISEIFQFLFGTVQTSTANLPTYTTPKSSLVVIADPASFWILDPDKKLQEGKNSISGFLNPKPGSYRLIVVPKSLSTRIIIAQFLENGQTLWKEYKHEGRGPKIATITFDPLNPQEDAMK